MTFKLAVIGDSLAQGFHSGTVGNAGWSFPAILARALGLGVGSGPRADFRVPQIPGVGLPFNIVRPLRAVALATGDTVAALEWPCALRAASAHLETVERYYQRDLGTRPLAFSGVYHNLGMYGLTIGESHTLTSDACDAHVEWSEGRTSDGFFSLPAGHRLRTARMVLNPARQPGRGSATVLDNLEFLVRGERSLGIEPEPLDALIVWLGSNDCLQTVVQLELRDMPPGAGPRDPLGRSYNLTSEEQFAHDFHIVAEGIERILRGSRTRVYVGNVPDITIPPIAKGLGRRLPDRLYERYGRFFLEEHSPHWLYKTLDHDEAATIQKRIESYNRCIKKECERDRFAYVDTAKLLETLAMRRNAAPERTHDLRRRGRGLLRRERERNRDQWRGVDELARERMRAYADSMSLPDHPLLHLDPVPSVLMLETDASDRRISGGLSSLDGVHPSTVGYGIAAEGFLRRLQVDFPSLGHARIPWQDVIDHDVLQQPLGVWDDVRGLMSTFKLPTDLALRGLDFR
jgi:hypothetical protein